MKTAFIGLLPLVSGIEVRRIRHIRTKHSTSDHREWRETDPLSTWAQQGKKKPPAGRGAFCSARAKNYLPFFSSFFSPKSLPPFFSSFFSPNMVT